MLFSNINGVALSDERFWPIYEAANDIGAVIYIHPEHPVNVDMMKEYWLMPLVGFLFDTTLAAASLTFSGVPERFPNIKWALCHLGGTIPYLVERLDRGFHDFKDCRAKIDRPPSTYLKEFYYDTVNFNQGALKLAIDFAGADHILAGSDYPHQIGSIPLMLEAVGHAAGDRRRSARGSAGRTPRGSWGWTKRGCGDDLAGRIGPGVAAAGAEGRDDARAAVRERPRGVVEERHSRRTRSRRSIVTIGIAPSSGSWAAT